MRPDNAWLSTRIRGYRHKSVATDQHRAPRPTRIIPTIVHDTPRLPRARPSITSPLCPPDYEYSLAARCCFADHTRRMGNATPFLLRDADIRGPSSWEAMETWDTQSSYISTLTSEQGLCRTIYPNNEERAHHLHAQVQEYVQDYARLRVYKRPWRENLSRSTSACVHGIHLPKQLPTSRSAFPGQ